MNIQQLIDDLEQSLEVLKDLEVNTDKTTTKFMGDKEYLEQSLIYLQQSIRQLKSVKS
jgi:hypothetical protein